MMNKLLLNIVSPDREIFSGEAKSIIVTTIHGEVQILAGHAEFFAPLATGRAKIAFIDGTTRTAAISGGFILVSKEETKVVTTTFEFSDEIDMNRAQQAKQKAEELLKSSTEAKEMQVNQAKLSRAITRINVASAKN